MVQKRLKNALRTGGDFVIVAELCGGPNFNFAPIGKFMTACKQSGGKDIPAGFNFVGLTSPQSPGGIANIEPADVHRYLKENDLLCGLDFIPHISCKDLNSDGLTSELVGHRAAGVESLLVLTGDKPAKAKRVFEVEAIGLLSKIRRMNNEAFINAPADKLALVKQFCPGAAVSPFKYTEASQMQQYYKMEKKIRSGAEFLITQVGWDWKKSVELMRYLKDAGLNTPVLGNVYLLSTISPAPRLMHDIKLPGCFVSDELFEKVMNEGVDDHIERAAQQVAMYRAIGAAGADIGGVHDYEMFIKILKRAAEIGCDWEKYKDNLCWPAKNSWYLYDENGNRKELSRLGKTCHQRFFDFMHAAILDPKYPGFHVFKGVMAGLGTKKGKGLFYRSFNAIEKSMKYCLFDCEECGDCYLPENFSWCTIGGCEKGMDNAPCGDSTVDGKCGNNLDRICIGEYIYKSAAAQRGGLDKLRGIINKPRIPELEHTSSILNYLFGKDHTMRRPLIGIGELIHGSIPKTGKIMGQLHARGEKAFVEPSEQLDYVRALIEQQAGDGADYIAVNLDVFGEDDPAEAVRLIKEYAVLVRKWGMGVPICIDSSDDNVLIAGLKEWYNTDEPVKVPLINSIKEYTIDNMMPLKKHYDFKFVGLLVADEKQVTSSDPVGELYNLSRRIFKAAVGKYNFKPDDIFFDTTVFPLAIDMPMTPGQSGFTYRTFQTIGRIKNDPEMKGVHCSLGVTNSVRDLPGRKIGVARAYVEVAIRYGLDAGIINVGHNFGIVPADPELVKLVEAFANLDGDAEHLNNAMKLMGEFCAKNRKTA